MNPSSSAIHQRITALKASPGIFQRLVEEYARVAYSQWFTRISPGGRRPDDVTRKGWPDASAELPDGATAILEATHSERWERHLTEDVARTEELGAGAVGAFLFAAWAAAPEPRHLEPYRQRLLAAGIPRERTILLFRDQLVSELTRPIFARLWVDPLGLPASCQPFDIVDQAPQLFGSEERTDLFAPRRSEYKSGLVCRPQLAGLVEERLARSGWALVRGRGAAGKTTLALAVALGAEYRDRPVYYLDLVDWESGEGDQARAVEALATRGDAGVLFIVDNVHLATKAARRIFTAWQELAGNGSRILLLGRMVTPEPDVRGRAHPFEDLEREVLELEIDSEALVGVFRRILARVAGPSAIVPDPPPAVVQSWLMTFGGDLIAFSTAVTQRIGGIAQGDWTLLAEDARRYVEKEYLAGTTSAERDGIARLAAVATLELNLPIELLGSDPAGKFLDRGWVIRSEHGGGGVYVRLRLIHPSLGFLLLSALAPVDRVEVLRSIAAEHSFTGTAIAHRMMTVGQHTEARATLAAIADSPRWFSWSFGPKNLPGTAKLFLHYGVLTAAEIDARLSLPPYRDAVCQGTLGIPPYYLVATFGFTETTLPRMHASLSRFLEEPPNRERLIQNLLRSSINHIHHFLEFSRQALPSLYAGLIAPIQREADVPTLVDAALRAPLYYLAAFLDFTEDHAPELHLAFLDALATEPKRETLVDLALRCSQTDLVLELVKTRIPSYYDALLGQLATEGSRQRLLENALHTPIQQLIPLLAFANSHLREFYDALIRLFETPENRSILVATVLRTPLGSLASFLTVAAESMPSVARSLAEALASEEWREPLLASALATQPAELAAILILLEEDFPVVSTLLMRSLAALENRAGLIRMALASPLEQIAPFLRFAQGSLPEVYAALVQSLSAELVMNSSLAGLGSFLKQEYAAAVVEKIDAADWEASRLQRPAKGVEAIPGIGREFARMGRPELGAALARGVVDAADVAEWHRRGMHLSTLSHTLRLAGELPPASLDRFLNVIATPWWLKGCFLATDAGPLAGSLFTLWCLLDEHRLARFRAHVLSLIIQQKLDPLNAPETTTLADLVSLLGVAALLGLAPSTPLIWVSDAALRDAIAERTTDPEVAKLGVLQSQFWVGLRELAGRRKSLLRIDAAEGSGVLALWREAIPEHPKLGCLNRSMIAWLERCSSSGWRLVRDDRRLQ